MYSLAQKVKKCRHRLVAWKTRSRSNSNVKIDELLQQIEGLRAIGTHCGEELYFKNVFTSTCHTNPTPFFADFESKVTAAMNQRLCKPVSREEVKRATFSIHPQSVLGEDGMTAKFFQCYWDTVNEDVFRAVRSFFAGGILKGFNHTQICLISKVSDASSMTQIRLIILSTVIYKIMSKNKRQWLEYEMAVKLDMSKAYDRVEWAYLWFIMEKLGFEERWIGWIQELVTNVSYSINVEGQPFGYFKPNRDLWEHYRSCSDQQVNLSKSAIFFSHSTPMETRRQLANALHIDHIGIQDKYLELLTVVNKSKRSTFNLIKEKVRKKVQHWKRNLLSAGGRHVLIKAIGEAIPIYSLSCFRLPNSLIMEIHHILAQFW
ncbi:uncharacterized protein [Arachis hypogaea]|uniref:uncharacterized protein n=1 Tax=Arachis hypogaea TaxID=3818 RepID=UPI000DEC14E7